MIVFAQVTHEERIRQTFECLNAVNVATERDPFDRKIIIFNQQGGKDRASESSLRGLREYGCEVYLREWNDDFPGMRNEYLKRCQDGDWVVVSDPDEVFCHDFLHDLKDIVGTLDKEGARLALINSVDTMTHADGSVTRNKSSFYKNLIIKYSFGTFYEGVGATKNLHETLMQPEEGKVVRLDDKYFYTHDKHYLEVWERAGRNVFISGGGNNVGNKNASWKGLREICNDLKLKTWPEFRDYMRKGSIDLRLQCWLIGNRREGFDYQHEMMETFRWYFEYLHPEEKPEGIDYIPGIDPDSEAGLMKLVEETYLRVLGRHADTSGKEWYTGQLMAGTMKKDALEGALRASLEYQNKTKPGSELLQKAPQETLRIQVPVAVDIKLTDEVLMAQLMKSNLFIEKYAPSLRMKDIWEAYLSISKKVETGGKGTDDQPVESYAGYIKDIKEFFPLEKFKNLLDIGAGAGAESKALQDAGYKVVGLTLGHDNAVYAKEKFGITLLEMDMHFMHFPPSMFDGVVLIHTLEHALSPHLLIGEIRRVLRDAGRVYVAVPDPLPESSAMIWHTNLLNNFQIQRMFKYWGFKAIQCIDFIFIFEKLPDYHEDFKNFSYLKHVFELRG